ncbi:MAG: zinc-finger domain-containing protein [Legionellaceae bacterium]|nr:zinc-finger domain-containing protein [Legionellaceae bacterium]
MAKTEQMQSCVNKKQILHQRDLPLSCPSSAAVLWNAHPKVYLPIEKTGEATCPYCGTLYCLKDD